MVSSSLVASKMVPADSVVWGGCSCIDIAFDAWHESHRSLYLHNADSESPPAIEPFQALPCIVTLWRIAS